MEPLTAVAVRFPRHSLTASGKKEPNSTFRFLYGCSVSVLIDQKLISPRYLDQFGMSAKHNTKVYCRQALVGGFYGLLEKETFVPNPDYYRQVHNINFLILNKANDSFCFLSDQCTSLASFDG